MKVGTNNCTLSVPCILLHFVNFVVVISAVLFFFWMSYPELLHTHCQVIQACLQASTSRRDKKMQTSAQLYRPL